MTEELKKILGEERYKELIEFSEKLGITPEEILRKHVDSTLFGREESNLWADLPMKS